MRQPPILESVLVQIETQAKLTVQKMYQKLRTDSMKDIERLYDIPKWSKNGPSSSLFPVGFPNDSKHTAIVVQLEGGAAPDLMGKHKNAAKVEKTPGKSVVQLSASSTM